MNVLGAIGSDSFARRCPAPTATILVVPSTALVLAVFVVSLLCLVALGAAAARIGGAPWLVGATRVTVWGVLAMAATAAVGRLFGTTGNLIKCGVMSLEGNDPHTESRST